MRNEVAPDRSAVMVSWRRTRQMPAVRGFVIGRPLLFPPDDNAAAEAVVGMP